MNWVCKNKMTSPPAGCDVRSWSLALSFCRGISNVSCLVEPVWAALVACKNTSSSEAVCLLYSHSSLCKFDAYRNVLCDKNVGMMFLHAESLHRTERIKWRLELFADWEIIWPIVRKCLHRHKVHSLHSQLNDFILAATE